MTLNYKTISAVAFLILALGLYSLFATQPWKAGAVEFGGASTSTTTPGVADETNLCPQRQFAASSTTGMLTSVNVTEGGGGYIAIYDATTSNATLRAAAATSSLLLVYIPASPTESSYTFDGGVQFNRGLYIDYATTGTGVSSSTIGYQCQN